MTTTFYVAAAVALLATALAITHKNVVHGLLYLIVSLLAVALMFYALGAPFVAALEVIIYAGAIMVLFVFVMMLLNLGPATIEQERRWQPGRMWVGPVILSALLLAELAHGIAPSTNQSIGATVTDPHAVGVALFTRYALGVEIASMLLLSGLIGAYHVGRRDYDST
jgi:NADH-quinone oxidoreductase subunit J